MVPYCKACLAHVERAESLRLGAIAASILVSTSSAILVSLSLLPLWATFVVVIALALLPPVAAQLIALPRQIGHATGAVAVVSTRSGLAAASFEWVTRASGTDVTPAPKVQRPTLPIGSWGAAGLVIALVLTPVFHFLLRPPLRVLNFTDHVQTVFVDGRALGEVTPTSGESSNSGRTFRIPSGERRLTVRSGDGSVTADLRVVLRAGRSHLFAPGAKDGCLYVQRVAYGRSSLGNVRVPKTTETVPLRGEKRFWVIEPDVETWFLPERVSERGITTGSVVAVLRMGRCR